MEAWREELYHHGIDGQKWGQQNGPPYPLDYEDHSSAEKNNNSTNELNNYKNNKPVSSSKNSTSSKSKSSGSSGGGGGGASSYVDRLDKNYQELAESLKSISGMSDDAIQSYLSAYVSKEYFANKDDYNSITSKMDAATLAKMNNAIKSSNWLSQLEEHLSAKEPEQEEQKTTSSSAKKSSSSKTSTKKTEEAKEEKMSYKDLVTSLKYTLNLEEKDIKDYLDDFIRKEFFDDVDEDEYYEMMYELLEGNHEKLKEIETLIRDSAWYDEIKSSLRKNPKTFDENEEEKRFNEIKDLILRSLDEIKITDLGELEKLEFLEKKENQNELKHHGIDGQKWGKRNGPPYPLDPGDHSAREIRAAMKAQKKANAKDLKWAKKNNKKIYKQAYQESEEELRNYVAKLNRTYSLNADGKVSAAYVNAFNKEMSRLMSEKVSELSTPSGKAVNFVAKRGEVGVYMAISDRGYDMSNVKNGVWNSGRIAYRKTKLNRVEGD